MSSEITGLMSGNSNNSGGGGRSTTAAASIMSMAAAAMLNDGGNVVETDGRRGGGGGASDESPQPLPLTTSNSSRCTSPMSPPSDQNGSSNEDESFSGMNLTINKSAGSSSSSASPSSLSMATGSSLLNSSGVGITPISTTGTGSGGKISSSSLMNNHHHLPHHINIPNELIDSQLRHKGKVSVSDFFNPSRSSSSRSSRSSRSNKARHSTVLDNQNLNSLSSPDITQLLLEYRQVLLDVLTKSISLNDSNDDQSGSTSGANTTTHKGVILPVKCQCGFTSELSKQITRSSTYVHQLELKFRSLMESAKMSTDPGRYTPKRPWFINSPSAGSTLQQGMMNTSGKMSLLKKKKVSRMAPSDRQILPMPMAQPSNPISLYFGSLNNNNNNSNNGTGMADDDDDDDDDLDSEDDDVNGENLPGPNAFSNGGGGLVENETSCGGKTILEDYLESMKNMANHHQQQQQQDDDDDDGSDDDDSRYPVPGNALVAAAAASSSIPDDDDDEPHEMVIDSPMVPENLVMPRGPANKRIDVKTKKMVLQLYRNNTSFTDISRQMCISRKSVRRIIRNYMAFGSLEKKEETRIQKDNLHLFKAMLPQILFFPGPSPSTNGLNSINGNGHEPYLSMGNGRINNDDDSERNEQNIHDADADMDDDDDAAPLSMMKNSDMESSLLNPYGKYGKSLPLPSSQINKSSSSKQQNMSLIHGPFNGGHHSSSSMKYHNSSSNGNNGTINNRLSLIKSSSHHERNKPYDLKMRHSNNSHNNSSNELLNQTATHHHNRIMKSHTPIVPPLPTSTNSYPVNWIPSSKMYNSNNGNANNSNSNERECAPTASIAASSLVRSKNKNRHSVDMSFKESLIVPEADKNNNTTLSNCNVTITSTSSSNNSNNSNGNNGKQPNNEQSVQNLSSIPSIPAALVDGSADPDTSLVPKNYVDGFPAGIMNSLNPNRATKLTLEDFNVVWQLRSQHWTHNQIRKYFQQRGKSISKSSISRIMNGKQRNFQQFFNVVPSGSNF